MSTVEQHTTKPTDKPITGYRMYPPGSDPREINRAIAVRGREAGKGMGEDPVRFVNDLARRVLDKLPGIPDDSRVDRTSGVVLFRDYLLTRILELVVHTLDLASALGTKVTAPRQAMLDCLECVAISAVDQGKAELLAMAVTGRIPLPQGFSLV